MAALWNGVRQQLAGSDGWAKAPQIGLWEMMLVVQ